MSNLKMIYVPSDRVVAEDALAQMSGSDNILLLDNPNKAFLRGVPQGVITRRTNRLVGFGKCVNLLLKEKQGEIGPDGIVNIHLAGVEKGIILKSKDIYEDLGGFNTYLKNFYLQVLDYQIRMTLLGLGTVIENPFPEDYHKVGLRQFHLLWDIPVDIPVGDFVPTLINRYYGMDVKEMLYESLDGGVNAYFES
jgi:hypothetical protein